MAAPSFKIWALPLRQPFFSDLTHYIRSGDFILALLRNAKILMSTAFAVGALAHYVADNYGHRLGINRRFRFCIRASERNSAIALRSRTTGWRM